MVPGWAKGGGIARSTAGAALVSLLALGACRPSGQFVLADPALWQTDASADPLPGHAEGREACDTWVVESGILEVDTGACPYFVATQPLPLEVRPEDTLDGGVVWDTLYAEDPGPAHLALAVDGEVVWERSVDVPGEPGWEILNQAAGVSAPEGAALTLHLHNHGLNQWRFLPLELVVE